MLLREADRRLGLIRALDAALPDPRDPALGSSPTRCRLEARASRRSAVAMHEVRLDKFVASFAAGKGVGPCMCAKGRLAVRGESDEH